MFIYFLYLFGGGLALLSVMFYLCFVYAGLLLAVSFVSSKCCVDLNNKLLGVRRHGQGEACPQLAMLYKVFCALITNKCCRKSQQTSIKTCRQLLRASSQALTKAP